MVRPCQNPGVYAVISGQVSGAGSIRPPDERVFTVLHELEAPSGLLKPPSPSTGPTRKPRTPWVRESSVPCYEAG